MESTPATFTHAAVGLTLMDGCLCPERLTWRLLPSLSAAQAYAQELFNSEATISPLLEDPIHSVEIFEIQSDGSFSTCPTLVEREEDIVNPVSLPEGAEVFLTEDGVGIETWGLK